MMFAADDQVAACITTPDDLRRWTASTANSLPDGARSNEGTGSSFDQEPAVTALWLRPLMFAADDQVAACITTPDDLRRWTASTANSLPDGARSNEGTRTMFHPDPPATDFTGRPP